MAIEKIGKNKYLIRAEKKEYADILIFADENILAAAQKDRSIEQLKDASRLPGVISPVVGLPDLHEGYGLPIGGGGGQKGKQRPVSARGVGFDIYCGGRF